MLGPRVLRCSKCGQLLKEGEDVTITNTGRMERVGGAGMYKDALMFKGTERVEHDRMSDCKKGL